MTASRMAVLRTHLLAVHRNKAAPELSDAEAVDQHHHEHHGPGGLRNHDAPTELHDWTSRNWIDIGASDPSELELLVAYAVVKANWGGVPPTGLREELVDASLPEARAVIAALREAGLLLDPGAGGTSEYPASVQFVLDDQELRRLERDRIAHQMRAYEQRWETQGYYRAKTEMMTKEATQ